VDTPVRTRPTTDGLWQLEQLAPDRFAGWCRDGALTRVFGGQVVAQALAAAGAVLGDAWSPMSLHAHFVREGRSSGPIEYVVAPGDDDELSLQRRHVLAVQQGRTILSLEATFAPARDVPEFREPVAAAELGGWVPSTPDEASWLADQPRRIRFELRFADRPSRVAGRSGQVARGQTFWFRAVSPLPDHELHHACALAYASDLFLVSVALANHGLPGRSTAIQSASLDHTVWFHRPVRADDWITYEQTSPTSAGGRGLSSGRMLDQHGAVVATIMQEVLLRLA
jgi:acyl-CoA thioesterase-2